MRLPALTLCTVLSLAPLAIPAPANAATAKFAAQIRTVDAKTKARMIGVSWHRGCPVPISDLRIITMPYWGFDRRVHTGGQLMVHKSIANRTVAAFKVLYDNRFPIRRMQLIETYGGNDDRSMAADNTSAFNCREVANRPGVISNHARGLAIDLNTVENPYVVGSSVSPKAGRAYLNRRNVRPGMVVPGGVALTAFTQQGFSWGGNWKRSKDYQHFDA